MGKCIRCNDTGMYLGNGMIMTDCNLCDGSSAPEPVKVAPALDKINRRSKSYQNAIKELMEINPEMSRDDAVKLFDKTYAKV